MVIRGIFLIFLSALVCAQTPDDAAASLVKSIAAHLAPNEIAHLTTRNVGSLAPSIAAQSQQTIDRALRKRVRNPATIEVTLTFSENNQGYLMIAEIHHENDRAVEMEPFRIDSAAPSARTGLAIEKKMIWQQDAPILDVAVLNDQMIVLDTAGIARYDRRDGAWTRTQFFDHPTVVRDPRGRLEIDGASVNASIPGETCRGTWDPQLTLACEPGGMFTAARNTIESPDWAPFYSQAQVGADSVLAETNGRTYIYDTARKPAASFRDWGSDFVKPANCPGLLADGPGDRSSPDFIALYDIVNRAPVRISDPADFPGPVTALWPSIAVIRNLSTRHYEAYSLTIDCGR